ncbi:MAG: hypothetical protein P1U56_26755 [Saprospiraceae bacterium]|nr:hypothetical protein [Saprospiraceae bacterium]
MLIRITMFLLFFVFSQVAKSDIGYFDVIKFQKGEQVLFASVWSHGILKNHDLNYYSWSGELKTSVFNHLQSFSNRSDSLTLYDELVEFKVSKLDSDFEQDSILFILKKPKKYLKSKILNEFEIIDAFRGNTIGYTYSSNLTNEDNIWVEDYETEILFSFSDYELCSMRLYGIKNNLPKDETERLKLKIDTLLKDHDYTKFNELIAKLKKKNIIMIGFCSC